MVSWSDAVGREITGKGEVEVNRILTRVAWENMWKNPGRTFVLYWQKFFYWFAYSNKLRSDEAVPGVAEAGRLGSAIMLCCSPTAHCLRSSSSA